MKNYSVKLKIGFKFLLFVFIFSLFAFSFALADTLGQNVSFNIDSEYEYLSRSRIPGTLRKISERAYWYVSDDYWAGISEPEKNLFLSKLDELAREFDQRIYPAETAVFGSEDNPGIDNDSRITVFITKLVDQAGGYFDTTHLYEKTRVPESNEREMVFLNSSSIINGRAKIFLAHEFEHLIAFYQKDILRDSTDDTWLNEARAEYAPRLLGYDDDFNSSNIRRRIFSFQQNSSEPLGEWKNEGADYGAATLFSFYLADNYGERILVDSLRSRKGGIESLDEAFLFNGLTKTFSDVFADWTIANILNDSSVSPEFSYKFPHLASFKIQPTQSFTVSGIGTNISISNTVKDLQPVWYEFSTSVGNDSVFSVNFSASAGSKFKVPYIAFKINGEEEVGFVPVRGGNGTLFLENFGSEIYKVILIPANHSKISDFTENDPASSFTLKVELVSEVPETATAPTIEPQDSQEIIQSLIDQINFLLAEIARLRGEVQTAAVPLERDLFVGLSGEDVRWLQDFLINEEVYPEARITGYFGPLTQSAVIRLQQKYGIFPQIGYVGVKTRVKIKELVR